MHKGFLLALFTFVIFCSSVQADPYLLNFSLTPRLVWVDGQIDVHLECYSNTSNETLEAWLKINSPIKKEIELVGHNGTFKGVYATFPSLGPYEGALGCADANATVERPITFTVRDLSVRLVGVEPAVLYPDTDWQIHLDVREVSDVERVIDEGVSFGLWVDGQTRSADYFFDIAAQRWTLVPQRLGTGWHDVLITADYEDKEVQVLMGIEVRPVLSLYITSIDREVLPEQQLVVGLRLEHKGNVTPLTQAHVSVWIDEEAVPVAEVGAHSIKILTPPKRPGTYQLRIGVGYRGYEGAVSTSLDYVLPVEGRMVDPEGKAVSGRLTFSKADYVKHITVHGPYAGYVPLGTYRVEFVSRWLRLTLTSIEMAEEWTDALRVDQFGKAVKMPGLKVAGGVAVEFAQEFEQAELEVWYDSRVILNEMLIKVYGCANWNFQARVCAGDWQPIAAEIDTIRDVAKFTVTHLSAFIVGQMASLNVVVVLDKDQYFLNEQIGVSGVVRDEEGAVIEGANVSYEFVGSEGEVFTNREGVFSLSLLSPTKSGKYTLTITASKGNYVSASVTREVSVTARRDLAIVFGLHQTVEAGKNQTINIKLINSGQTDLHNLRITISGLPADWFDFSPHTHALLEPGAELLIRVKISAPPQLEATSHRMKVDVVSDEVEKSDSFVLILQPPLPEPVEEAEPTPAPTGFFTLPDLSHLISHLRLAIPVALLIALLLAWKRGRRGGQPGRFTHRRSTPAKRLSRL